MWLATRLGFFSISEAGDGTVIARSHLRSDLENLLAEIGEGEIRNVASFTEPPWELAMPRGLFHRALDHLLGESNAWEYPATNGEVPGQEPKAPIYQSLRVGLLKLRMAEWESTDTRDCDFAALEEIIRGEIKSIAKQSGLVGVDAQYWDVTRISWTGEEWAGFRPLPGHCYVEAFEHANPPHDFIYVVRILNGKPELIANYEGDMDAFYLTSCRPGADALELPESVRRP